jgi:iron(III) transport system ATP-binding protein
MISMRGLRKAYGSVVALDGINLDVADGEVLALLGPSGCGKSTTLQLVAGFVEPTAGEIAVNGRILSRAGMVVPPEHRGMSLIFQSYAIWPHKTVAENVAFGLSVRRVPKAEIARRVHAQLTTVHLEHLAGRYPSELSGGQQQRIALARALAVDPEILLLDEPLSNLDAHLREEMRFEIRRLHDTTGITMIYVTHDQTEAMVCADRIAVMNRGHVDQVGTGVELYEQPRTQFVASFIAKSNILPGHLRERGVVDVGGAPIFALDATEAAPGAAVSVSVRPHRVALGVVPEGQVNRLQGRIERVAYLGDFADHLVALDDGTRIRASVLPEAQCRVGETVDVYLPVRDCRVLAE